MESATVMIAGLWVFAVVSLIGGIMGRLDGLWIIIIFLVAVMVSFGVVVMPKGRAQVSGP